ncbi:peroxidase/cytochrome P450 family protein [Aspergillus clavatus NRRL 1]|uniref:Animal haem peroxidase family protein n=1 Tax=Aspergillus clavatus (strain ATCC 1007 / CBS 513.65 / DSM 816 / NCTC 3887 / NRRL 1 / QM 1276 / 107) TaxID=344612 RepID=A1CLX2_ASPCL|nr:uncharacterized protein ACLA_078500 [Aspergillus clavatus NRRL 1]EAW09101.1 animal haem peroxidase family protein [Aspergillus clavatus NRRL 1]
MTSLIETSTTGGDKKPHNFLNDARQDLVSQAGRIVPNLKTVQELVQTVLNGGLMDDRRFLIENIIQVAASLPNTSNARDKITDTFVRTLWDTLQHPPLSYLGDQFKYRAADGSYNNIMYPHLGAAGSYYARTVTPQHPRPAVLPDPALNFDTLLAREGPAREHPSKISSNLFYLATLIIHDLFHTDEHDGTKLKNSSYLDLGPLYGHNQEQQDQVRTFNNGLLKPDTFAEKRLLSQPPGVCALLVAFNRFHNWVVGELASINEGGRFSLPPGMKSDDPACANAQKKRDNDLFQTGRLITCGLYVNIILNDYLRTILNLNENPVNSDWKLDPRKSIDVFDKGGFPRGVGNQVSAEFNMIYRWHAAINNQDEAWVNDLCRKIFGPSVDASKLSVSDFLDGLRRYFRDSAPDGPSLWTFGGLKRRKDGRFADSDIVRLLQEGCDNVAGAFGARNTPKVIKAIEMLGIQQGRQWGLATLNEFRTFFKLKPYSTFEEVNSDPSVAGALEGLYGHPDNIELYVGIQAEEAKKPFLPGSGLCPGFTISAAILSDAVALVRGDRFYTVDYSPANLTSFGFNVADSDSNVAGGGVMYKLLMKAFPGWYQSNSVYALYPFTTPGKTREIMDRYGNIKDLDFGKPSYMPSPVMATTWAGVTKLLEDQRVCPLWGQRIFQVAGHGSALSEQVSLQEAQRRFITECFEDSEDALEKVRKTYEVIITDLLGEHSRRLGDTYQVDVVRDVTNLAHAYFCARFFRIPLTEPNNPSPDAYTPRELSDTLSLLFGHIFLDLDPSESSQKRAKATKEGQRMGAIMAKVVATAEDNLVNRVLQALVRGTARSPVTTYGTQLIKQLLRGGKSIDEVVWMIIPTAAAMCASQAQMWAHMVDLYLSDEYISHWPAIQELSRSDAPEAFDVLKKYALEGFRLSPVFGVLRTAVDKTSIMDGGEIRTVEKNTTVFADVAAANRDASRFRDPLKIRLDRPADVYIHRGWEPHASLGSMISCTAGAVLLRVLGRMGNVRRAPGPAGEIRSRLVDGRVRVYLREDGTDWTHFPQNQKILFDRFA